MILPRIQAPVLQALGLGDGPWPAVMSVLVIVLPVLLIVGWSLYVMAVRVDRLHRQVLGSRATLEAQLTYRAEAACELAASGALDPASSLLLIRAAREALDAGGPIVDDGLDPGPRVDAVDVADVADATDDIEATAALAQPGQRDHRAQGAAHPGEQGRVAQRAGLESDLSRVLRTVLDAPARAELTDALSAQALARLDRACSRLVLARRFHNTHVSEARALRSSLIVRVFHLAGRAPMPQTFDADDDAEPAPGPTGP